jgi:hypothetical protein
MEFRCLARPVAQLLTTGRQSLLPLTSIRGHKTTARTKRALKKAPHDDFLPDRTAVFPAADSIIYNPPSSEASPDHTPFIFLPRNDPRRQAIVRMRAQGGESVGASSAAAEVQSPADLAPEMRYKRRSAEPKYNVTADEVKEMRRLREEDPLKWSVRALALKFNCSPVFVNIAAPAPKAHLTWLRGKMERQASRWGPKKTQAREDKQRRTELMYRGEL